MFDSPVFVAHDMLADVLVGTDSSYCTMQVPGSYGVNIRGKMSLTPLMTPLDTPFKRNIRDYLVLTLTSPLVIWAGGGRFKIMRIRSSDSR